MKGFEYKILVNRFVYNNEEVPFNHGDSDNWLKQKMLLAAKEMTLPIQLDDEYKRISEKLSIVAELIYLLELQENSANKILTIEILDLIEKYKSHGGMDYLYNLFLQHGFNISNDFKEIVS